MTWLRPLLREAAYRSGALALSRRRSRNALTVVLFHRVIDPADPDFAQADRTNTVPLGLFEELIGFFRDYYNVVGLADLIAAADRSRPLPEHPLLISFDDGWADNLRYAAPLLSSYGLPAVIFISTEPLVSPAASWWQQQVFDAARRGALAAALEKSRNPDLARIARRGTLDIVCFLDGLAEGERDEILQSLRAPAPSSRMMLTVEEVPALADFGIAVGIHGHRHLPLTTVADLHDELQRARSAMASLGGDAASTCVLACPHGRWDARVLRIAREVGMRLVFTSDPVLNPTVDGMIEEAQPLGRILVVPHPLTDRFGRLDAGAAAAWLWRRPVMPPATPATPGADAGAR